MLLNERIGYSQLDTNVQTGHKSEEETGITVTAFSKTTRRRFSLSGGESESALASIVT